MEATQEKIKVTCPHCRHEYRLPADQSGKKARCKECKQIFPVHADLEITPSQAPPPARRKFPSPSPQALFKKLWTGCPAPFRTSFLTTLGVVCALAFAWYAVRLPRWSRPAPPPVSKRLEDTQFLDRIAALMQLRSDYDKLIALQKVRVEAAGHLQNEVGALVFYKVIELLQPQTESLYLEVRKEQMPNDDLIGATYEQLLTAIEAEYNFQQKFLTIPVDDEAWLKHKGDIEAAGNRAVSNADLAALSIVQLHDEVSPGLLNSVNAIICK